MPPEDEVGTFSATTPRPVGVTAPERLTDRFREPGRDERESGRSGGGIEGGSMGDPDGRLGWNGRVSSSTAER